MSLIRNLFHSLALKCLFMCLINCLSTSAASTSYPTQINYEVTSEENRIDGPHIARRDTYVNFPNNRVTRSKYDNSSAMFKPKLLLRLIR